MKKLLAVLLVLFILVGCSKESKPVVKVYNWGEYIDREVIKEFEKEYNVKVQYDVFTSNEFMYTKLASEDYDVLVPSDYMIQRLIEEDKLQEIDLSKITNFDKVSDTYKGLHFDPENKYSVPYFVGSVGMVYNKEIIDEKLIEEKGWDILFEESLKDKFFFYNSERDAFMVALKALGYSMNTEVESELNEAYDWLVKMKKDMKPVYVDDYVIDAMASGEKDLAIMYSGDAAYVLSENESLAYIEPHQGTNTWTDGMVISKNAQNVQGAHDFINFILREDVSEKISTKVGYTSPITSVSDKLSAEGGAYEGISAYIPRANYAKDEEFFYNAKVKTVMNELWSKITASK
ncbi:MAG: ABC transporter substrate-binding protein [Erysipelothrix sp.]|nr:ABC transporter substrate-binding protein [Erysipelothrix sp.]